MDFLCFSYLRLIDYRLRKIKNVCPWPGVLRKLNLSVLECKIPPQNSEAHRKKPLAGLLLLICCHLNLEFKDCDVLLL